MKLTEIGDALYSVRTRFDIDGIDLMMLSDFSRMQVKGDETTIMAFIGEFVGTSQATTHSRIKKLCDKNILKKADMEGNLRYKTLEKGAEFDKLVKLLASV
jgi:DNA-binding Lrp family transcriptional regulator